MVSAKDRVRPWASRTATTAAKWLVRGNGEIIALSQAYESKESAKKGISSVQTNAAGATLVELTSATT
ncbi:YegP family protein [Nocardia fluminea]|uniref:YegP family protein n=1 Tax=Nocardia fluminea TaxID=134984 RepID=UPI00344601C2